MSGIVLTNVSTHRDAWVEVNLKNLEHNIQEIKKCVPKGTKLLGVVKADAYGHGAVMLAPTILASGIDMLGVASIDEGLALRDANINCEILVLGAVPTWAFESAIENDISIAIFSKTHIDACKKAYEITGKKVKAHIKLDTGMNRIGVCKNEAVDFIKQVQNSDFIDLKGIFTHFAMAESIEETDKQISIWENIISNINTDGLLLHIQNSAATMCYDIKNTNMCRVGIALYGLAPDFPPIKDFRFNLKPLISLKGRIVNIHEATEGDGVSYSYTYRIKGKRKIATIPIGYADGVSRALSNKIYGILNGKKVLQVGNITMDQMMFDITGVDAETGDVITLLDEEHSIDEWAKILDTIHYELICRLKLRLPRVYIK